MIMMMINFSSSCQELRKFLESSAPLPWDDSYDYKHCYYYYHYHYYYIILLLMGIPP